LIYIIVALPVKRVFTVTPEGSRTRGRPCSRWADNIDMDIGTTGGRNWKATAVNRENCGRLLRKAMDHKGLSCRNIIIIIISYHRFSFFPGTSPLEPVVNPTTQASSLSL
jgi:hypothetical protein